MAALEFNLDDPEQSVLIDVKIAGHVVTVDLVKAHTECVLHPARAQKKTIEDCLPDVKGYLIDRIKASGATNGELQISDTQATAFYWYLVKQMTEFEKKVLPISMQKPGSLTFSDSTRGEAGH